MILPHEQLAAEAVLKEAARAAEGRGAVFLYRGDRHQYDEDDADLMEVADPYLKDYSAHDAFARAEMGSSQMIKRGSAARARAMPTRCFSPPDS